MPAPTSRRILACWPATIAVVPRRQMAVAALKRGELRRPRRSSVPEALRPVYGLLRPAQKTSALSLFSALGCRTHLASAARLATERRACTLGRRVIDPCSMDVPPCPSRSKILRWRVCLYRRGASSGQPETASAMGETRKLAAILVADVVGYSRLAGTDEDRTLARLRALRSDLMDPTITAHHGRFVKRTGDGAIVEFRSAVDAVRCAIEFQSGMVERNADLPPERRIEFRIGIHVGDVVEESDGDLMGDGVNIAARLEGIAKPGAICLSEQAHWQVKSRLDLKVTDLGLTQLKNISEPVHVYSLEVGQPAPARPAAPEQEKPRPPRLSLVVLPFTNIGGDPEQEHFVDGVNENFSRLIYRASAALS